MTTLKKHLGEGGAGLDDSMGHDTLYDVLYALVSAVNDLATQFNQLKADYDASTTPTTATDVTTGIVAE